MNPNKRRPQFCESIKEWGYTLVFCYNCSSYYDLREVREIQLPAAGLLETLFVCPRKHHTRSLKLWSTCPAQRAGLEYDDQFLSACGIEREPPIGFLCETCDLIKDDVFIVPAGNIVCGDCVDLWEPQQLKQN